MSETNPFNTPEEQIVRLVDELRESKDLLREVSRRLAQVEMRVQRAFPSAVIRAESSRKDSSSERPTMTAEQVMSVYEEMVVLARKNEQQLVQRRLAALNMGDLNLLRRELGVSLGKKKPSRRALEDGVLGRVRESVLLSRHSNRDEIVSGRPEVHSKT